MRPLNMEPDDHPRVLFITPCAFNRSTGGGITFGNLFAGWPKDRLATAHNDTVPVTTDVCEHYYRLGQAEIRRWVPRPTVVFRNSSNSQSKEYKKAVDGLAMRTAKLLKNLVFGNGLPERGVLTPQLENWIENFKPEVIYTILGSNGILELVEQVQKRWGIPLVIHMMDDWPSTIYRGGLLSWIQRRRMRRLLRGLLQKANLRIAICENMARNYELRYGKSFLSFQNAIDVNRWDRPAACAEQSHDSFQLLYVGSILDFAQSYSLADCCRAVSELSREGHRVSLEIYSPDAHSEILRKRLEIDDSIRLNGPITDDEKFFDALLQADLLVLPVNFDRRSIQYIKHSMPTKVPAYLISGTPILVYGPASVAQVEYAAQAGWGAVVSNQDVSQVKAAIMSLWKDQERRSQLVTTARQVARRNHDVNVVRSGFQKALSSTVDRSLVTA